MVTLKHEWRWIRTTEGKLTLHVLWYECRHCGKIIGSNDGRARGPCATRQQMIDFDAMGFIQQVRALNPPRAAVAGIPGALPPDPQTRMSCREVGIEGRSLPGDNDPG